MADNYSEATNYYLKASKIGKKECVQRAYHGLPGTVAVLDELLPDRWNYKEVNLGLVSIPVNRIDGTRSGGRQSAFSPGFMPILDIKSEFASKWISLAVAHLDEGIREPIKAVEYLNRFYVIEGNKRVSVMKFFDAGSIRGEVIRLIPPKRKDKEIELYYEFMDFYSDSEINYIYFTKSGSFKKLIESIGMTPGEKWPGDVKKDFYQVFSTFERLYKEIETKKHSGSTGDAFLSLLSVYGYEELKNASYTDFNALVHKALKELEISGNTGSVDLLMDPEGEKTNIITRLFSGKKGKTKIGFIYEKTPFTSAWTYNHELGRMYLEDRFGESADFYVTENIDEASSYQAVCDCIEDGCQIIFATTPSMINGCLKAAIDYPEAKILNCSLNLSYASIRTYYARMHEAKFLMGVVAGSMAPEGRILYIANYPLFGTVAEINAFALGARLVNPRADIKLEWTSLLHEDIHKSIDQWKPEVISGEDSVVPSSGRRDFGLYQLKGDSITSLAMPIWNWGKFYERIINTIEEGGYDSGTGKELKSINYWWGLSSGMVDVVCSKHLSIGTKRLVTILKNAIINDDYTPFTGILYSQEGMVSADDNSSLSPSDIAQMNWLAENITGHIPDKQELKQNALPVVMRQGVKI